MREKEESEKMLHNLSMEFTDRHFDYLGGIEVYQQESSFGRGDSNGGSMGVTNHNLRLTSEDDEARSELSVHASRSVIGLRSVVNNGDAFTKACVSMGHDEARELAHTILSVVGEKNE